MRSFRRPQRHPGGVLLGENVVVACGRVVPFNLGQRVEDERAEVVESSANAQAVGAGVTCHSAVGMVLGDCTIGGGEVRAGADQDAAAERVAPVTADPACAADCQVAGDRTTAEGCGTAVRQAEQSDGAHREAAGDGEAAARSDTPDPAEGQIVGQRDAGDACARVEVNRDGAAGGPAARGAGAAGPANGPVVGERAAAEDKARLGQLQGAAGTVAPGSPGPAGATDCLVVVEVAVRHGEDGARLVEVNGLDGAAQGAKGGRDRARPVTAVGHVAGEGRIAHSRVRARDLNCTAPPLAQLRDADDCLCPVDLVPGECATGDCERA